MYLGIDIGTSSVKTVLVDSAQTILTSASQELAVSRPQPLWSEQNPEDWWQATLGTVAKIRRTHGAELRAVTGIGLSGQMHGATLLDKHEQVLRPAILWNDGRCGQQCDELESRVPESRTITGNLAMPGFTAPKLLWVAEHEPEIFARVYKILLPKDYVRLKLTGEYFSDLSDASGTLWVDVAARDWSEPMLDACGLTRKHVPALVEGSNPGGTLRPELARDWGITNEVVVAGGAGDNAAGAAGVGTVEPGRAFLSLGTSGVYFVANERFSPNPEQAVHAFCHCLPNTWHQMSVILSAASCLSWVTRLTGAGSESELLAEIESQPLNPGLSTLQFLPYLSGERTPHNNPDAKGVLFGIDHDTGRSQVGLAVLEGVAFALAEGQDALLQAGAKIQQVSVIGGGARSRLWGRILASTLQRPLNYHGEGDVGPAFGAARLGRLAATSEDPVAVCVTPPVAETIDPEATWMDAYREKRAQFARLYPALEREFSNHNSQ